MRVFGRAVHPRAFITQVKVAWRALWGDLFTERLQFTALCSDPGFIERVRSYLTDVPQASQIDRAVTVVPARDLRRAFAERLTGAGVELGALHLPMPVSPGTTVRYVDRMSRDDLRREYPSLNDLALVETDIVADAETLDTLASGSQDFIIASHLFEHLRNPIASLEAWFRVLSPGGSLYLVVPDKRATFDAHRVRTTLEHLVLDYESPSEERDFEHFVDYARFVHGKHGREALDDARHLRDTKFSIHYHVFLPEDVRNLVEWCSTHVVPIEILDGPTMAEGALEFHLLLRKPA